jgi:NhaA family Na+:H+ antiporter
MSANIIKEFIRHEASAGIALLFAAVLAMIVSNSALAPLYDALLNTTAEVRVGSASIRKPLLLWINDGFMAIFFLLVGLELKRELLVGELSNPRRASLPVIAAIGGMAMPALIYVAINWDDPIALKGWAIPSATDIAFALAVLSLLGKRVPLAMKAFLLAIAIADDLGAIVIIGLFYTAELSWSSLLLGAAAVTLLIALNRASVRTLTPYLLAGIALWAFVLKSGVHATLAGLVLAAAIPLQVRGKETPLASRVEHSLHPWVAFGVLPAFAFANTGVNLSGISIDALFDPMLLGIAAGLFLGNQVGICGFSWLAVKLRVAALPPSLRWTHVYGVAILCGIGFTMSLFIASLAFEQDGQLGVMVVDRLGILIGSTVSGVLGYAYLRAVLKLEPAHTDKASHLGDDLRPNDFLEDDNPRVSR